MTLRSAPNPAVTVDKPKGELDHTNPEGLPAEAWISSGPTATHPETHPSDGAGFERPELGISVIETAVLLLVVGIACGLFFKGREWFHHTQAVALMDRVTEVQAAWYAFNNRFAAAPGDSAPNGNHNGRVDTHVESTNLWSHLFQAGYLTQLEDAVPATFCSQGACVSNGFGGQMYVAWEEASHQLHVGQGVSAQVLAVLDERYDDGLPLTGSVRLAQESHCQQSGFYQLASADCEAIVIWL
jgi:hypothetical protein